VYHMQIDMTTTYMEEYWSNSLNHFLITPLKWIEFFIGNIIMGIIKFSFVLMMYLVIGFALFSFKIADWPVFLLGIGALSMFGIILGILTMGIIVLYRENAYTTSYIVPDLLVLLSGVYYPITIFPQAVQSFVKYIPAVYGFDILKSTIGIADADYRMLFLTTSVWLIVAVLFFAFCYRHAKKQGKLGRMS